MYSLNGIEGFQLSWQSFMGEGKRKKVWDEERIRGRGREPLAEENNGMKRGNKEEGKPCIFGIFILFKRCGKEAGKEEDEGIFRGER